MAHSCQVLVSTYINLPALFLTFLKTLIVLIDKIDGANRYLYLDGDMKAYLLPGVADSSSPRHSNVCEIFGLSQLITEPTRETAHFQFLIDLCITKAQFKRRILHAPNRIAKLTACKMRCLNQLNATHFNSMRVSRILD